MNEPDDWISRRRDKQNKDAWNIAREQFNYWKKLHLKKQVRFWLPIVISVISLIVAVLK